MVRFVLVVMSAEVMGVAGYSPSQAIAWSGSHCADSDGTECAEFVSNALRAGGHTMCWSAWSPTLDNCLKKTAGWKQTSFPCSAGCAVVWYDSQGPYHFAMSRGGGSIDQHNPNRCSSSGSWGSNYCLCPPYFEGSLETAPSQQVAAAGISMSQIASYWIAKHSKDNCQTAVAVAMAESRGDCNAQYVNGPGSIDRGLWQINSYWHPECSDSCAYSCSCNAGCAVNVWKSSGWTAWATYNNGLHRPYLNDAAVACGYSAEEVLQESHSHRLAMASKSAGISMSQIASYWIAKHSKDNCQTAVAVAMAESRGDCNAQYVNGPGSIDRGLWQINSYWHPECSDSCAYSCSCNAGCAVNVWKSSGWTAWATYNNGLHRPYLNDAAVACGYSAEEVLQEAQTRNATTISV